MPISKNKKLEVARVEVAIEGPRCSGSTPRTKNRIALTLRTVSFVMLGSMLVLSIAEIFILDKECASDCLTSPSRVFVTMAFHGFLSLIAAISFAICLYNIFASNSVLLCVKPESAQGEKMLAKIAIEINKAQNADMGDKYDRNILLGAGQRCLTLLHDTFLRNHALSSSDIRQRAHLSAELDAFYTIRASITKDGALMLELCGSDDTGTSRAMELLERALKRVNPKSSITKIVSGSRFHRISGLECASDELLEAFSNALEEPPVDLHPLRALKMSTMEKPLRAYTTPSIAS